MDDFVILLPTGGAEARLTKYMAVIEKSYSGDLYQYTNLRCPHNIATSCWCIMVDIPKTGINNPNMKTVGGIVEHTL